MKNGTKIYSLEALNDDPLATRNTLLFAALTAMGIPPEPDLCGEFVEEIGGQKKTALVWRLRGESLDRRYQTGDLIRRWNDPDFVKNEPEHPFAYIKTAFENHSRAVEFIKDQGPIAIRRRGKKVAIITRRTSPELKKRILDELNKD